MLRSTHKAAPGASPLPEGWTEHKAPTGHAYYYHAATKKSTYTRPTNDPPAAAETQHQLYVNPQSIPESIAPPNAFHGHRETNQFRGQFRGRNPRDDRPKHRKVIPGCEPWILVTTKFKRRFVFNPELGESFWKFPQDVLLAVAELDRKEAVRKERRERGEPSDSEPENALNGLDDEYEEVEVTDEEDMDAETLAKRQKVEESAPLGPVEFNEDDFAQQLALMGQEEDDPFAGMEFDEEPPLDPADAKALFSDLLADFRINPYTPWDQVIENMSLVEDPRYTCLPNMKTRREVFDEWSRDRMAEIRAERETREKKDPKIGYIALLDQHASPKLYWPEFKRKFKKEEALRNSKLSDKDREKWYREHINRLKLPQSTLKSDLKAMLKEQPLSRLNRSITLETLPTAVTTDLRYISLRPSERDPLIEAYIGLLDPVPDRAGSMTAEESARAEKTRRDRQRREDALREREQRVEEDKRKRRKQEKISRGLLKEAEADLERAMNVKSHGLKGYIEDGQGDAEE